MKLARKALLVLSAIVFAAASVGAEKVAFGGYYKNFTVGYRLPLQVQSGGVRTPRDLGSVANRLRLEATWRASDLLTFEGAGNLVLRVQDRALFEFNPFGFSLNPQSYRVGDPDARLYPEDDADVSSLGLFQNIDRLKATLRLSFADVYLGRQAVAWGFARVINPTDVIAPYAYTELDTEHRIGVDALRARIPVGLLSEIDIGWVFGDDFAYDRSAGFLRGRFYVKNTDISPIAVLFREHVMLGMSITRSVSGAGVWMEAAYTILDDDGLDESEIDRYWRVTVGADYSLTQSIYGFAEYHYNQAGGEADDYVSLPFTQAYQEGAVYLLGEHYLISGVVVQISPLVTLTAEAVFNATDPSVSLTPRLEYNIAESIYIAGGAVIGIGDGPEVTGSQIDLGSEFGSYPDYLFTSFRVYY